MTDERNMKKYKECRGCGTLFADLSDAYKQDVCNKCNTQLSESNYRIDYTNKEITIEKQVEKIEQELYNLYIKDNPENIKKYELKLAYNKKSKDEERAWIAEMEQKSQAKVPQPQQTNLPKCPTCGSTNIHKISGGNKVGSAALFGLFSLGHISKTFKCDNCGMKF